MLDRSSLIIRTANSSVEEGLIFGRFVDEVSEGGFRFLLGRRIHEILATAYIQPGHGLSYQRTLFAEIDGTIVGMVSGYTAAQHRESSDRPLLLAPGCRLSRRLGVAALRARWRMFGAISDGDFYVEFLIVGQGFRGRGIGGKLLDAMEERARAAGSDRFALDVSAKNDGGRRFYERRGMSALADWPTRRFMRRFVLRMTTPL